MKGKMKEKMKGDRGKKSFFFLKKVCEPSNPPDEFVQNVSKRNPFRTNCSSIFSSKVQNLTVFKIIYMIRIGFFGSGELIQRTFSVVTSTRHRLVTRGVAPQHKCLYVFSLFAIEKWQSLPWETRRSRPRKRHSTLHGTLHRPQTQLTLTFPK